MHSDERLRALVELAASRHNAFSTTEAAHIGIPQHRLRRREQAGELLRLHPRVWSFAALPSTPQQVLLAAVLSVDGGVAGMRSAAWLHGWMDAPERPTVWVPARRRNGHARADLRWWNAIDPARDTTLIDRIPTLNAAATLCSLGPHVERETLERCLDEFLRSHSQRWLVDTMDRLGTGKPGGVATLRAVLDDPRRVGGVTDSWFERLVAKLLTQAALPPLVLQHEVVAHGRHYRIDIACPELRLGIEAHNRTFHWGTAATQADNARDLDLVAAGWQLLYVTWAQVNDPDTLVDRFVSAAQARAELFGVECPAP